MKIKVSKFIEIPPEKQKEILGFSLGDYVTLSDHNGLFKVTKITEDTITYSYVKLNDNQETV